VVHNLSDLELTWQVGTCQVRVRVSRTESEKEDGA
jgi:hypothetical protein